MKTLGLVFLTFAFPAWSDEKPWIDYELVMSQHAEQVVTSTGERGQLVRHLSLPGAIEVECSGPIGEAKCTGRDMSDQFGVGCFLDIFAGLDARVQACPELASQAEAQRLRAISQSLKMFVMENAVPPLTAQEMDLILAERTEVGDQTCEKDDETANFLADVVSDEKWPETERKMGQLLAIPRLPIWTSCF